MSNYAVLGNRCHGYVMANTSNKKYILPFNNTYGMPYTKMLQYPAQQGLMRRGTNIEPELDQNYFGKNSVPDNQESKSCSSCGTF